MKFHQQNLITMFGNTFVFQLKMRKKSSLSNMHGELTYTGKARAGPQAMPRLKRS
jgi:hypothetical protein